MIKSFVDEWKWLDINALFVSSGFTPVVLKSARFPVPPRVIVMHSLLRLSIMYSAGVSSLTSVPCRQPDLSVQYHLLSKVDIRRQPLTPLNRRGRKGEIVWELIWGLGILVIHPPNWAYYQSTSFIRRIFFSMHTWGRSGLVS